MSYILDALRKADAERERGNVPSIHAQPLFAGGGAPASPTRAGKAWLWPGVAVIALALIAAIAWALLGSGARRSADDAGARQGTVTAPSAAQPTTPPPIVTAQANGPSAASIAPPATASPNAGADSPTTLPPATAMAPPRSEPAPRGEAAPRRAKPAAPLTTASAKAASAPTSPTDAVPDPAGVAVIAAARGGSLNATVNRIYAQNELPEEIRRQLPAVNVGGSMYSSTPANRILILNGQVLHEGEKITPDLVLHQIRLKAAVLAFKSYLYVLNF